MHANCVPGNIDRLGTPLAAFWTEIERRTCTNGRGQGTQISVFRQLLQVSSVKNGSVGFCIHYRNGNCSNPAFRCEHPMSKGGSCVGKNVRTGHIVNLHSGCHCRRGCLNCVRRASQASRIRKNRGIEDRTSLLRMMSHKSCPAVKFVITVLTPRQSLFRMTTISISNAIPRGPMWFLGGPTLRVFLANMNIQGMKTGKMLTAMRTGPAVIDDLCYFLQRSWWTARCDIS